MCSVMTRSSLPARLFVVSHLFHHFSASAHFCLFFPPVSLRLHSLTPRQQLTPQCLTPNQSECKPTRSAPPLTPSSSPRVAPDLLQFTKAVGWQNCGGGSSSSHRHACGDPPWKASISQVGRSRLSPDAAAGRRDE